MLEWFAQYDSLVEAGDLEAMADMASFPVNEVTDDADGFGIAGLCDRDRFIAQMRETVGDAGEVSMESRRYPVFITRAICFVITDATITAGGHGQQMRYGDLLVREPAGWKFQTMVAGGFCDQL